MRKRVMVRTVRGWLALLACSGGVLVALALGQWQLDRAAQKTALQAQQQAQADAPVLSAETVRAAQPAGTDALLHRRVLLQGQWLAPHSLYLDNRQMHGRPGFFVLTPLQLPQGDVVLVQRGWIARNFHDRNQLQPVPTPSGTVVVEGVLRAAPARLLELGEAPPLRWSGSPIVQNLDLQALSQASGWPLWPWLVVQHGAASEGLLRDWPQPDSGVATHHGYAFQWFAIAAVLAGMAVWFLLLRPLRAARDRDV